jgi:chromosome segregation ATPase
MRQEMQKLEDDYNKKTQNIKNCQKNLEKKQTEMEQLNKVYGELIENKKDDNEGEFEVAINKLQKKIKELRKDIRNKDVEWLTKNQELIRKENILNNLTEEVVDKRSKRMNLDRKKMKLNEKYSIHEKEVKEIEISLKQLRDNEMGKFSKLLEKNINTNENLEHQIFDINIKFKEKLTNLENESVKLEMEIEVLREEKSETLAQIIEAERQITLWERKIELQEQLQKIIKPETGRKEIDEMKNYINKQKTVYKKLISEQEGVIKNMEKSVQRRDYIKVKYPVNENKGNEIKNKGNKTKELNNLMEQINKINKKKKEYSNKIASTKTAVDEINDNFNQLNMETFTFKDNAFNLRNEYFRGKINTNNLLCKSKQYQESSKMIEDFSNNKFKPKKKDALREELKLYQNENKALISSLNNFKIEHSEMSYIIDQVLKI